MWGNSMNFIPELKYPKSWTSARYVHPFGFSSWGTLKTGTREPPRGTRANCKMSPTWIPFLKYPLRKTTHVAIDTISPTNVHDCKRWYCNRKYHNKQTMQCNTWTASRYHKWCGTRRQKNQNRLSATKFQISCIGSFPFCIFFRIPLVMIAKHTWNL